jgi:two-component system phosphate regulon sensor histidine kinase PhoR
VEGLLNFGRVEAGAMQYRMENLDAAEFLQATVSEFRSDSERRGYRVELITNGAAPMVRADRAALGCVLRNLLDNAVNYSPECFTVWVELEREKERVAFRVRDRGIGIPPSEQEEIFQKFFRGAEAKARSTRGAGIGLAMARQIVAHHKGEIEVESRPGQGSTFTVLLPEATG